MQSSLEKKKNIQMYSTHNEGIYVVAERFIRVLKTKTYKHMTSISKNGYIDKLDSITNKYNNTYHKTIKVKLVHVKENTHIDFDKQINKENPKSKVW